MHFFVIYVFVYFIHGADLRHARRNLLDGAGDTARFINLIHRIDKFEEKNPTNNNNDDIRDKDTENLEYQAMKLLQKNYDVARKFNERRVSGRHVQYISNPEVVAAYRQLPEEHTEVYDDISDQANTQRSYAEELERIEKLPIYVMRSFRKRNVNITPKRSKPHDSASDDTDGSNDAREDTRANDNRRTKLEDQGSVKAETIEDHSNEPKKRHSKSAETLNLLRPIVEQVLSKYSVKLSQEKEESIETEVKDVAIKEKRKLDEPSHNEDNLNKNPLNSNNSDDSNETTKVLRDKENKRNVSKKKNDTERLSSNTQVKKKKKNVLHQKQSGRIIFTKDDQEITKESASVSKENILKPKRIKENSKSEEAQGDLNEENKKEQTKELKNKLKGKTLKNTNSKSKKKRKIRINKEIHSKENENNKNFIDMEETVMDWANYDEDNKGDEQQSEKNDKHKSSKSNKNKERSGNNDKHLHSKKINTKRKGDENWDDKFDDDNKKTEDDNWSKKKEKYKNDDWDKKDTSKKKNRDWSKDVESKEDNWNKKDDSWDKKYDNDGWDKKKKKDKKNNDWDEKDINWDTKDETVDKNKKWDKIDDTSFKKTPKRDNAWDSVGTEKKQNLGWGNYDSFKNIKDKTNNNDRDYSRQEKRIPARIEMKAPNYQSWDRPARDNYYERPRNKQGGRQSLFRTSIPFVGKKAVYAD